MTALDWARWVAKLLHITSNEFIAILTVTIKQAEVEARADERRRITAEWLAEALPPEVLLLAAEKVVGKGF